MNISVSKQRLAGSCTAPSPTAAAKSPGMRSSAPARPPSLCARWPRHLHAPPLGHRDMHVPGRPFSVRGPCRRHPRSRRLSAAVAHRRAAMPSRRRYASCYVGSAPVEAAGPATRAVVAVLGGYRHLYCLCLGPALDQLALWRRRTTSLSFSLFSLDCYKRLGGGVPSAGAGVPGRQQQPSSSLFLCKPVDVL